jgi:hypothetical protein
MSIDLKRPDDVQEFDVVFVGCGQYKGEKGGKYEILHKSIPPRLIPGLIRAVADRWEKEGYCLYTVGILQEAYDLFENGGSEFDCHITNCSRYKKNILCEYWDHEQCNRPEEELKTPLPINGEDYITAELADDVNYCRDAKCRFYNRDHRYRCSCGYWYITVKRCMREGGPCHG